MSADHNGSTAQTTQTSLDVLSTVRQLDGARLSEIVDQVGIAKSTAHKHLTTLRHNGYLRKDGETYHVGFKLLELGEYARTRLPAFNLLERAVADLTERTGEEVDFVAEDRGRILTVCESYHKWVKFGDRGDQDDEYRMRIGTYYPMHATASGKAILAEWSTERIQEVLNTWGLVELTDNTITDQAELFDELDDVLNRGYAIGDEEYTDGLRSVGQTVHRPDGTIIGSLCVFGPTYRIDGQVLERELPIALDSVIRELEDEIQQKGLY